MTCTAVPKKALRLVKRELCRCADCRALRAENALLRRQLAESELRRARRIQVL